MASQPLIASSILSADFAHLGDQITEAESSGADWLHIDVMDGHFVPNITMGTLIVEVCKRESSLPLDVHLMIEEPDRYLESFAKAGADHISVHVETCPNLSKTLRSIRTLGCKAGVAINPETPPEAITTDLALADLVLIMSVNPGFGGQAFIPEVLPKVETLRNILNENNLQTPIEIDGGIDESTLPNALTSGVQVFVAGNAIFKHPFGIAAGIEALRNAMPERQNR